MSISDTVPVWKKLYHTISGGNTTVTEDVVEEILRLCKDKLVSGLLQYTTYNKESFQTWKENPGLKDFVADNEMCNFIHLLCKELNLDVNVGWTVICNFLMFEYFGKVDELKSIVRYDTNLNCLIDNIWYFFMGDRMFLLKTLRHIFEKVSERNHPFRKQFAKFLKSIDGKQLFDNLVATFDVLINEIDRDKVQIISSDTVIRWIHRNNREQAEVITLLTHAIQYCKLDGRELEKVLVLFIRHGFTRHPLYSECNTISKPKDLLEIKCAEIGCMLAIADRYWANPGVCKMLPKNVEKNLELLQIQGDNSVALLLWVVLKTSVDSSGEVMDYCNTVVCELIKKKVFQSLHSILTNKIFDKCKSGDIVVEGVFKLMAELLKICADFSYLFEQDGVCYVTAELLKRKGVVVLDYLGPIFQLSLESFPFVFNPFLEMSKSLISIPEYYNIIMTLLKNIPGFLAEIPWNDSRERFNLVGTQKLFIDSDLFIIPEGTVVERFKYQGMEFARFIHPFSFFLLMEQFIKSLSVITFEVGKTWYCYDNLTELVQIGFRFILHILKHYKGDYRSDTVLRKLVQRLEIVPTQFSEGPMKNVAFIKLYFETNVTLITHNLLDYAEAFPPIIRRQFMPQVSSYNNATKAMFVTQIYNESILFKNLKDEESTKDHSLLIEYLKLIEDMVEKNLYHQDVQVAGIWYLLYAAFPLHQQWPYEDDLQMTMICKYCVSIFIKVFQKYRTADEKEPAYEVFQMCRDAFLCEDMLIANFLSVFYKDKYYMVNLMEEESNWISGSVLEHLETMRLQMVLLLMIYKLNTTFPEGVKSSVDDKISTITKAVSAFMVNPYSTPLRILSFRFLEVLAGDDSIPLMALLELDYDQIQRLFLDKLRDPMEDDNVKMHIIELISNCIFYQHGMTAAFFNVKRSRKWYSDSKEKTIEGDTVTDFMIDYLHNIKKSCEYLRSPLQLAILRVMTNLWLSGKQHLIKDIIGLDAFWPLLADPLFKVYDQTPFVYAYIFKILGMQMSDPTNDNKFLKTVERFLVSDKQLVLWQEYIFKILKEGAHSEAEVDEKELLLKAWLEFILSADKEDRIKKFSDEKTKYLFVELSLDGFKYSLANLHCLETWMSLCLIHISKWGLKFEAKDETLANKIILMFGTVKVHYKDLDHNARGTILSIAQRVIQDLGSYFQTYTKELLLFLEQIGIMMEHEYTILEAEVWDKLKEFGGRARELMIPWTMYIHLANSVLKFENVSDCAVWFMYHDYLPKMVKCTSDLLNNDETVPLAKLAIHSLTLYAQSPLALDFLNINMTAFYDEIEPPITLLFTGKGNRIHPLDLEEGWLTTTMLMKFNQAFLSKFQFTALPSCFMFMSLHEQILQHVICIPEASVSLKALDLLLNTLTFFDNMLKDWQLEWYRKSNNTYNFVLMGTKKIINSCLYVILRPKNIAMYDLDNYYRLNQVDKIPITLMVGIMNRLITAVTLGFSILYRMNPSLTDLLDVYVPDTRILLIQNDFSVPKFELPIPCELTYGKLLCLAHFMCKTLDALHQGEFPELIDADHIPERQYCNWVGLVEHQDPSDNLPHQKLSAFLRYAMYEYSGLADPWIQKLNYCKVKRALELLMFFLAQQVFLYVKTTENESLPYYKRNLASELQFFYEYVRRHTSILLNQEISVSSTLRSVSSYKAEMDIMKKYLLYCHENDKVIEVVEKNFCLVIFHWFTNICHIR